MIYIDPPYGVKFSSNFQPVIGKRDVKDTESDLTREVESVKAYRDTWTLGIHSYLSYIRQLLEVAKQLLTDTGSVFVQIGDENLHLVRGLLDEVFGRDQFVSIITIKKTTTPRKLLDTGHFSTVRQRAKNPAFPDSVAPTRPGVTAVASWSVPSS